jgi:hypothetical protein
MKLSGFTAGDALAHDEAFKRNTHDFKLLRERLYQRSITPPEADILIDMLSQERAALRLQGVCISIEMDKGKMV